MLLATILTAPALAMATAAPALPQEPTPEPEDSGSVVTIDVNTTPFTILHGSLKTGDSLAVYGVAQAGGLILVNPLGQEVATADRRNTPDQERMPDYYLFWGVVPNEVGVWQLLSADTRDVVALLPITTEVLLAESVVPQGCSGGYSTYYSNTYNDAWSASSYYTADRYLVRQERIDRGLLMCGSSTIRDVQQAWSWSWDFWGRNSLGGSNYEYGMGTGHNTDACTTIESGLGWWRTHCFETLNPEVGIIRGTWYTASTQISQEGRDEWSSTYDSKVKGAIDDIATIAGATPWTFWIPAVAKFITCTFCSTWYSENINWHRSSTGEYLDYIYFKFQDTGGHNEGAKFFVQWSQTGTTYNKMRGGVKALHSVYYETWDTRSLEKQTYHWMDWEPSIYFSHG